jgi:colicin import membrane protein
MTIPQEGTFERSLMYSGVAHVSLALFLFVRAVIVPSEAIEVRRAIRVDVVDLPRKMTEQDLKPPAPEPMPAPPKEEPKPKAEPKAKEKPAVKEPKKVDLTKSQNKALDKIKAMAALDRIKNEVGEEKRKKSDKAGLRVAGNQIHAGNALTGLDKIEFDRYFDDLHQKVLSNWSIPQWLADMPLKAQVQILLDEKGFVTKKTLLKSSGNQIFDNKVLAAVEASSPLPAPPARLVGKLSTSGIILNFPE